jgi:competence protein ComEA
VSGAVASPGWYSLDEGDTLGQSLIAAGGTTSDADLFKVKLYVYELGETFESQRININRAESWLLEALPGIGPALAQRIVDYRTTSGAFQRVEDLKRVQGIGEQTYQALKDLISAG